VPRSYTLREQLEKRIKGLKADFEGSWEPNVRDVLKQMAPYRARWESDKRTKGDRKDDHILNNTPVKALRTQAAGLMAGVTSPARKWHAQRAVRDELNEVHAVKVWLDQVQEAIEGLFQTTNFYTSLSNGTYPDIGSAGFSALLSEENEPGTLTYTPYPIGQYWVSRDHEGKPYTWVWEGGMTVEQMLTKFGEPNLSRMVKMDITEKRLDKEYLVTHAIVPNDQFDVTKIGPEGQRWASLWWESKNPEKDEYLRQKGYFEFPVLLPRWSMIAGDNYGRGPGWDCRGDCKALQHYEEKLLMMVDKTVDPPMKGTDQVKRATLLPGVMTQVPKGQESTYEPAITINPAAIAAGERQVARYEQRIEDTMYVPLFQSLLNDERAQRATATEIEYMRQEVMLLLGPLLENLDNDLLEPAVERAFAVLERAGKLPEPPPELQDEELKIEFISVLHQIQQATGIGALRTLLREFAQLASLKPEVIDKLNGDVVFDEIARITGIRPDAVVSDEEVTAIRNARAELEAQERQQQQALTTTEGIKNVAGADPQQLADLAQQFSPAAAAQGGGLGPVNQ
jgi:hypothetical protein